MLEKSDLEAIAQLMDTKFAAFEERMDTKLDARFAAFEERMDAKLDARFAAFEERMDAKLDARFVELDAKLDARFVELDVELDARFVELDVELDARFSSTNRFVEKRVKESKNELMTYLECEVTPQIHAVAEGHQVLLRRLPYGDTVDKLEQRLEVLEFTVGALAEEVKRKGA